MARAPIVALIVAVAVACTGDDVPGPSIEHPTPEGRVHPMPPVATLRLPGTAGFAPDATLPPHLRLPEGPPDRLLGALEAPEPEVLGSIQAIEVDRAGRILVLDGQARDVRIFDLESGDVHLLGGYGQGPGQFIAPQAMMIDDDGRLIVGERQGASHIFAPDGDSFRFTERLHLRGDLWGLCTLNGDVYTHGMQVAGSDMVHRSTSAGEPIGAFGDIYRTTNNIVRYQISEGNLACIPASDAIVLAPRVIPEVRIYDSSGTLLWWMPIEGFRPIRLTELPSGGTRLTAPETGWHTSTTLVAASDREAFILQVTFAQRGDRGLTDAPKPEVHTFVVATDERRGYYAGSHWPRIVRWDTRGIFAVREDPHPELILYPVVAR